MDLGSELSHAQLHELLCLAMTVLYVLSGVVVAIVVEKAIQRYLSIRMKYNSNSRG